MSLDQVEALINGMTPEKRAELTEAVQPMLDKPWVPQPGPQADAFYSLADETLYGGAAGGGKTDLLVGLAATCHKRSLLFRLQSVDLDGLWGRLDEVCTDIKVSNNAQKKILTTSDGRIIEGGHLELPGSEKTWQGRPHDLIGFDEAAQQDEMKVEFVCKWLRSVDKNQRKRVVFATNPPLPTMRKGRMEDTASGDWLKRWFAPWLNPLWSNPAKYGELRWCFMRMEGDRLVTVWVDGPGYYDPHTGEHMPDANEDDVNAGRVSVAKSRTFIKSLLSDNAFLKGTGYAEKLASTPEPLKSMLLLGDFTVKGEDHPMQIIPTNWILQAQQRWLDVQDDPELKNLIMLVLFGDVAQGGADTSILSTLYTCNYFDHLVAKPGHATPTGLEVAMMVIGMRKHGAMIGLDGTGGWAGDTARTLDLNHNLSSELVVASKTSGRYTADGMYKMGNIRTDMWFDFKEALNPMNQHDVMLPPDDRLAAQLAAPHWYPRGKYAFVESKDDLRTRLGSSTDEADAVLGAWHLRERAIAKASQQTRSNDIVERLNGRTGDNAPDPHDSYDPRAGW